MTDTIQRVPASHGWSWFAEAAALFKGRRAAATWFCTGYLAITLIFQLVVGLIPLAGMALASFVLIYLVAGFIFAARDFEQGKTPGFRRLFEPFRQKELTDRLLPLAIVEALLGAAIAAPVAFLGLNGGIETISQIPVAILAPALAFMMLAATASAFFGLMAFFIAPLIMFRGLTFRPALIHSLRGAGVNWAALLVYSIVLPFYPLFRWFAVLIAAGLASFAAVYFASSTMLPAVTISLSLLVTLLYVISLPEMLLSVYVAYRAIFEKAVP